MKTKRMLSLIGVAALSLTATLASAAPHAAQMMTRSAVTRPAPRFAARTMTGARRFRNDGDNDRDDRFRRFHNRTFVFFDTFGFPFFYPYPYYGYYHYDYYGYNDYGYANTNIVTVVTVVIVVDEAGLDALDAAVRAETEDAVRFADQSPDPDPAELTTHVLAD